MEACEVADFSGPVSLITEVSGIETAVTEWTGTSHCNVVMGFGEDWSTHGYVTDTQVVLVTVEMIAQHGNMYISRPSS
jgi:hypothetical protein